jgi:hypothetical protein
MSAPPRSLVAFRPLRSPGKPPGAAPRNCVEPGLRWVLRIEFDFLARERLGARGAALYSGKAGLSPSPVRAQGGWAPIARIRLAAAVALLREAQGHTNADPLALAAIAPELLADELRERCARLPLLGLPALAMVSPRDAIERGRCFDAGRALAVLTRISGTTFDLAARPVAGPALLDRGFACDLWEPL